MSILLIVGLIVGLATGIAYSISFVQYGDEDDAWKTLIAIAIAIVCATNISCRIDKAYAEYQKKQQQTAYYDEHKKEILLKELDELERQEAYDKYMEECASSFVYEDYQEKLNDN